MAKYAIKRFFFSLLTLWVMYTAVFFLLHAIPGNPFLGEKSLPPRVIATQMAKYGLDKPVVEQYLLYTGHLLTGDFGISLKQMNMQVLDIIKSSFPQSAKIGGLSILFSLLLGIPLGLFAALKRNKIGDRIAMFVATLGTSVPSFVIATTGMYIFCLHNRWLPSMGLNGPLNYILPVFALTFFSLSVVARLARSSMLETIHQDYIRTARAKGLPEYKVILKHALKNAILPVVTYTGPMAAGILTGSFVIEKIFTIAGMGKYFVQSIDNRDYSVILGVTILFGFILILLNFLVDLVYGVLDPRIRLAKN